MKCNKCNKDLPQEVSIKCVACQDILHYNCAGLSEADFKKILPMNIKKWKCSNCKQLKKATSPAPSTSSSKPQLILNEQTGASAENHPSIVSIDTGALLRTMNEQFQQLSQDMAGLRNSFDTRLDELAMTIQTWSNQFHELENNISNVQAEVAAVKEENTLLRTQLDLLQRHVDEQDQKALQCNIEIQNLPEKSSENLVHIALTMGQVLGIPLITDSIKAVHRVPHRAKTDRPKNIILELSSRRLRDDVIAAARARRGVTAAQLQAAAGGAGAGAGAATFADAASADAAVMSSQTPDEEIASQSVFINEHLTLKNKILYSNTRRIAKSKQYKWVWVKHAAIFVRKSDNSKVKRIRTEVDLEKL